MYGGTRFPYRPRGQAKGMQVEADRGHPTHNPTRRHQSNYGVHVAAEKASIIRVQVPSCELPDSGT